MEKGHYEHSHVVRDRDGRKVLPNSQQEEGSSEGGSKKRRKVDVTSSDTSSKTHSCSHDLRAPSHTTQATSRQSYTPQQLSAHRPPPPPPRPSAPGPPPSIDYTFLPSLVLFLASITTCQSSLVAAAPALLACGLDSAGKLAILLSLSDDALALCVNDLAGVCGLNKLQQALFRKALKGARPSSARRS